MAVLFFMDTLQDVLKRGYYKEVAATTRHVCMLTLLGNPVSFCQTRRNGLFQDSFVRRRISLSGFNISDQNFLETYAVKRGKIGETGLLIC